MKFLCLICAEKVMEQMPEADAEKHYQEYAVFTEVIRNSGHFIGCNRLEPPAAATTIRVRNGKVSATDGPWVETKEQLGGYYSSKPRILTKQFWWRRRFRGRGAAASKCGRSPKTRGRCARSAFPTPMITTAPLKILQGVEKRSERRQDEARGGEEAECIEEYMSVLSPRGTKYWQAQ
ncbi:MAG: YciI family protein [Burkholderiales bacterium]